MHQSMQAPGDGRRIDGKITRAHRKVVDSSAWTRELGSYTVHYCTIMNYLDRGVGLQKIAIKGSAEEKQSDNSISYLKAAGKLVSREVSSDQ